MGRGRPKINISLFGNWEQCFFNNIPVYLNKINQSLLKTFKPEPLYQHVKILGGYAFKSSEYLKSGIPIIRISDFQNEQIVLKDVVFYKERPDLDMYSLKPNDIIIALTGATIGKLAIVQNGLGKIYLNQRVGKFVILNESEFEHEYVYWLARGIQGKIKQLAWGGAQPNVSPKQIELMEFPIPDTENQNNIIEFLNDLKNQSLKSKCYFNKEIETEIINLQNIAVSIAELLNESSNQSSYLTKLRQAILQEAIEGKLTADWRKENPARKGDPDYDAEALLEKIQAEKEKLIKEGKIKKQKPLTPIKTEEVPFELPEGWAWTRLGVSGWIDRGKSPVYSEKSNSIVLNQKCIRWFQIETIWGKSVSEKWLNSIDKIIFTKIGDILVNSTGEGTIGRAAIVDTKSANLLYDSHVLKYSTLINSRHILTCLNSTFCQSQIEECKGAKTTKQTELGVDNLSNLLIPLPPLAEQQAIVDRVEKLLSLVDELEKQISERKEQSEQLMQAVLREAFEGKA